MTTFTLFSVVIRRKKKLISFYNYGLYGVIILIFIILFKTNIILELFHYAISCQLYSRKKLA